MIDGFASLYIFMLAAFLGFEIISKVPVVLHTPLMSGSNFKMFKSKKDNKPAKGQEKAA